LKLLDLVSYDGKFLREMSLSDQLRDYEIEAFPSDFDNLVVDFHGSFLDTKGILLMSFDEVQFPDSFDLVTSIFQISYFPEWENQIRYSHRTLKNGGVLFLSIYQDGYLKNLARKLRTFLLARTPIEELQTNVYENSTHYKSGPFKRISRRRLRKATIQAGFSSIQISRERISRGFLSSDIVTLVATKPEHVSNI
jgi:SAM-dependent methyltransferase